MERADCLYEDVFPGIDGLLRCHEDIHDARAGVEGHLRAFDQEIGVRQGVVDELAGGG